MSPTVRRRLTPLAVLAALAVAGAGCQQKDTTPPPAPRLDPVTTPTMIPTQVLTGTAEYGSTLTVTRSPAFTAADNKLGPFTTTADPFSAKWRMAVPLSVGSDNVFTLTATDAAGNVSQPTKVTITANPPAAQHLKLTLGSPVVDADTGTLHATVQATAREPGVDLSGLEITFATTFGAGGPAGGVPPVTATTDADGMATADLTGLTTIGTGTLTATATVGGATASADFVIRGGAPSSLALQLEATVGGTPVGPGTDLQIPAGTPVSATVTITDGSQNTLNLPFTLITNAPGALVEGNTLTGLTAAGSWTVVAMVQGTAGTTAGMLVSSTATLEVQAGNPAKVTLSLGTTELRVGEPLAYRTVVTDGYGNVLTPAVTLTTSDTAATIDTTARTVVFGTQGLQTVTATVGTLSDTGEVVVRAQPDIVPPQVEITAPAAGDTWVSGSDMPVTVTASDSVSLSQIRIQVRGAFTYNDLMLLTTNPATTSTTKTFTVPVPGNQWGAITVIAEASDEVGNVTVSAAVPVNVTPANVNISTGGTAIAIAGGQGSGIRRPMGMTLDNSGHLYVACNDRFGGNGATRSIQQVDLNAGANFATSQYGVGVGSRMADVQWDPASGNLFISTGRDWNGGGGASGLMVMSPAGALGQFSANNNTEMTGLFLEGTGTLLASNWNNPRIESYDAAAAPPAATTSTTTFGGQLNNPWGVTYAQMTDTTGAVHSATYVADTNNQAVYVEHAVNGAATGAYRI